MQSENLLRSKLRQWTHFRKPEPFLIARCVSQKGYDKNDDFFPVKSLNLFLGIGTPVMEICAQIALEKRQYEFILGLFYLIINYLTLFLFKLFP